LVFRRARGRRKPAFQPNSRPPPPAPPSPASPPQLVFFFFFFGRVPLLFFFFRPPARPPVKTTKKKKLFSRPNKPGPQSPPPPAPEPRPPAERPPARPSFFLRTVCFVFFFQCFVAPVKKNRPVFVGPSGPDFKGWPRIPSSRLWRADGQEKPENPAHPPKKPPPGRENKDRQKKVALQSGSFRRRQDTLLFQEPGKKPFPHFHEKKMKKRWENGLTGSQSRPETAGLNLPFETTFRGGWNAINAGGGGGKRWGDGLTNRRQKNMPKARVH